MKEFDSDNEENIEITDEMLPKVDSISDSHLASLAHHCKFFYKRMATKLKLVEQSELELRYQSSISKLF